MYLFFVVFRYHVERNPCQGHDTCAQWELKTEILSDGTFPSFPTAAEVGHRYWHDSLSYFFFSKQFVIASRVCQFYLWQSVGRLPQRVTKPVTVRHFHSLSGRRQDIFESATPLSDMAVPKALPITAGKLEGRSRRLYRDLFANKITGRRSPQGTIWLPHIPASITPSQSPALLFIDTLPSTHPHTASCKIATKFLHTEGPQTIHHQGNRCQHSSP